MNVELIFSQKGTQMRPKLCVIALAFMFGLGIPSMAQINDEDAAREQAPQMSYSHVEGYLSFKGEEASPKPKPDEAGTPGTVPFSGIGYYTAPNSKGLQTFEILDRTTLQQRAEKVTSGNDDERSLATER